VRAPGLQAQQQPQCWPVCAAELVKQAVEEDNAGNYQRALELYKQGLDWFQTHMKFEKNPHSRKAITEKAGGPAGNVMAASRHCCPAAWDLQSLNAAPRVAADEGVCPASRGLEGYAGRQAGNARHRKQRCPGNQRAAKSRRRWRRRRGRQGGGLNGREL
jgi:hypothetical protein